MFKILVFTTIVALALTEKVTFENYTVFRIIPSSKEHIETLKYLEDVHQGVSIEFCMSIYNKISTVDFASSCFSIL